MTLLKAVLMTANWNETSYDMETKGMKMQKETDNHS